MQEFPPLPPVEDAPEGLLEGHLWIQELVAGAPLRFVVEESGWLAVGDRDRLYGEEPPIEYRFATRAVREGIDRGALADVPAGAVLFGVATRYEGIEYDWERLPPFLGTDVWSPEREAVLPPDAAERAFEGLGLAPVNALEKEVPARHFDLGGYEPPASAWTDGPPAGIVIRNKRGDRAARSIREPSVEEPEDDPAALAGRVVTAERVGAAVEALGGPDRAGFDTVRRSVVDTVLREEYARLVPADRPADVDAIVDAVGDRVREHLVESPE